MMILLVGVRCGKKSTILEEMGDTFGITIREPLSTH